uniref:Predicted protein n=1 Tax=Hordeum vulgare subsp. vulgare TaxID=112509 RepID=F2E5W7_HORVV|nr:predicted protein [Hordeum vulgare subsp. vulgare]
MSVHGCVHAVSMQPTVFLSWQRKRRFCFFTSICIQCMSSLMCTEYLLHVVYYYVTTEVACAWNELYICCDWFLKNQ